MPKRDSVKEDQLPTPEEVEDLTPVEETIPVIHVSPEIAQVSAQRVYREDTGGYDDQWTWDGPENGIVPVSTHMLSSFIDSVPWDLQIVESNPITGVTYMVRSEVTL